jgi:hypothetical protein
MPKRERVLTDREAMERIARVFDDAEQTVGDAIEEVARLVRLTGRALKHDDEEE